MSTFNWVEAIYGSMGLAMILLYIPQIKILAQASTAITGMSAPTWGFWSFGYLTHFLYGYSKLGDMKFCLLSLLSSFCCFIILAITLYKNRKYKNVWNAFQPFKN